MCRDGSSRGCGRRRGPRMYHKWVICASLYKHFSIYTTPSNAWRLTKSHSVPLTHNLLHNIPEMRYSATTAAFVASALMFALAPQAAQAGVTAFSTGTCGGDVGLDVPCDGSCHAFDNRHSFRVCSMKLYDSSIRASAWLTISCSGRRRVRRPLRDNVRGPRLSCRRRGPHVHLHEPGWRMPGGEHRHKHCLVHLLAEQHLRGLS